MARCERTTKKDRAARRATVRVLLAISLAGCAAPPPPASKELSADFDAPRPSVVASLLQAAANREARGDVEGALLHAERARQAAPQSGAAALREAELRAWSAIRAGDESGLAAARESIREIAQELPDEPAPRLADARLELATGDPSKAEAEAAALVAELPESAAAHALLSRAVLEEDPRRARDLARRAVELARSDPEALGARARAHDAFGAHAAAADDARRALLWRPDADLVEIVAKSKLVAGDAAGAAREIERTLEAERSVSLELLLARTRSRLDQFDAAEAALVRAKSRAGDDPAKQVDAIVASVLIAIAKGTPAASLEEVRAARALGPDDSLLAEAESLAEEALKNYAEAEADALQAIDLDPRSVSAWHRLGATLGVQEVKPTALERIRAAAGGDAARGHAVSGRLFAQLGDIAAARREYEAALKLDPDLAFAQLGVAETAWQTDPARALALAEPAQAALGWNVATARALGNALYANERYAEAVDVLEIGTGCADPWPGSAVPLQVSLAFAFDGAGKKDEARRLAAYLVRVGAKVEPPPDWLADMQKLRAEEEAESDEKSEAESDKKSEAELEKKSEAEPENEGEPEAKQPAEANKPAER
jgi:tetratricopeptide (TPR) repeat protein